VGDGAGKKKKPVKTSAADERRTALRRAAPRPDTNTTCPYRS